MKSDKCSSCDKPAVYLAGYNGRAFCSRHFVEFVQNKVKRNIQKHELIQPGDRVSCTDPALKELLTRITKNWPVELTDTKPSKLAEPVSLNQEVAAAIDGLAQGNLIKTGFKQGKQIFPFRNLYSREIELYSELRSIPVSKDRTKTEDLLEQLEKEMPGTLFSFQASFEKMGCLARPR